MYSCYAPASLSLTLCEFEDLLDNFILDARTWRLKVIVADSNAWALDSGSKEIISRERSLLEAFVQLHIVLTNKGDVNIYWKVRLNCRLLSILCWRVICPRKLAKTHLQSPQGDTFELQSSRSKSNL